ncbi:ABC transporter substrate-binding protein [Leptolyngbya sp. 7M]|uniref:ABC transporter substrate-binding protein n=1 Tax=Leptolyngbya sp. 7M TaxID=2812896 RepID=UPI001B8ACD71|nr:ABC transporter substrate-binding protein [Leptolyngbya sp. 7M]QYO63775.1 ABC transporter substrate-binding protein [Leptolyngbya sp. 7M]
MSSNSDISQFVVSDLSSCPTSSILLAIEHAGVGIAYWDLQNQIVYFSSSLQSKGVDIDWVMPKEGGFALTPTMSIVKNPTASLDLAAAYIDTAISTDVQTQMTEMSYVLPTNKNVPIPAAIAQKLGNNLDEILTKLEFLDWATINKNRTEWVAEFDKIVQV